MAAGEQLAKLRWRARRGMRELDAVLQSFLAGPAKELGDTELAEFAAILELPDPELLSYITRRSVPADPATARLIERVIASHRP